MEEAKLREEEAMKTGWFMLLKQQVARTMYCIPLNSMYFSLEKRKRLNHTNSSMIFSSSSLDIFFFFDSNIGTLKSL